MDNIRKHKAGIKRLRENNNNSVLIETESDISLYYLNCTNCTIIIPHKIIKAFFENCTGCHITIQRCVTPIEILRAEKCHFVILGGNFVQIDLSKLILFDLRLDESNKILEPTSEFYMVYCKTWNVFINIPNYNTNYELLNDYFGEQFRTDVILNNVERLAEFKSTRI